MNPDLVKIRAVEEWPVPSIRKHLQRFLGFTNFYRRFIRDYSKVVGPSHSSHIPSLYGTLKRTLLLIVSRDCLLLLRF